MLIDPDSGPKGDRLPFRDRMRALGQGWGLAVLATVVLGGIFTVHEAAAIGVVIAFLFGLLRRRLGGKDFLNLLGEASSSTAMIYIMIFGATIFSYFISVSGGADAIVGAIGSLDVPSLVIIGLLLLLYIFLGAFFEEVAAMVITLPFVIPIIQDLGYDLVWWGIINIVVIGMGMLTLPIGINVMLLNGMNPDIGLRTIYRGIWPFFFADVVRLALLTMIPALTLWLPIVLQ